MILIWREHQLTAGEGDKTANYGCPRIINNIELDHTLASRRKVHLAQAVF